MKTAKWFYDLKSFEGEHVLQGTVTTSTEATKKTAVSKIIFKIFGSDPAVIGWNIPGIKLVRRVEV